LFSWSGSAEAVPEGRALLSTPTVTAFGSHRASAPERYFPVIDTWAARGRLSHVPTFENGWICRECWSANRETDNRCYRCHATPKYREMPEVATVSETASKPPEERRKVTSLTAPPPAAPVESAPPAATTAPAPELSLFVRLRTWVVRTVAAFSWLWRIVRAVPRAPGATKSLVTMRVHAAVGAVTSSLRGLLAHRRAWIALAWAISGVGCAFLFSVAFGAPVAASVLVVLGVAIFSALTTAMTASTLEHPVQSGGEVSQRPHDLDDVRRRGPVTSAEPAQHAEALGSRPAR
jgi:hypothetical protein